MFNMSQTKSRTGANYSESVYSYLYLFYSNLMPKPLTGMFYIKIYGFKVIIEIFKKKNHPDGDKHTKSLSFIDNHRMKM